MTLKDRLMELVGSNEEVFVAIDGHEAIGGRIIEVSETVVIHNDRFDFAVPLERIIGIAKRNSDPNGEIQ